MKKRERIAKLLSYSGGNSLIRLSRSFLPQNLIILAYHRVKNVDKTTYPFDLSLISASVEDFEWQIQYILKHYNIISFKDVLDYLEGKSQLPKNPIIITFDDGFDDNYHSVFPLAQKYGFLFTVFLATDYIGAEDTFWFEKAAFIFSKAKVDKIALSSGFTYELGTQLSHRRACYINFIEKIKFLPNEQRLAVLQELNKKYSDAYENAAGNEKDLSKSLTWQQVSEMASKGVEFGGHGAMHSVLTTMNATEITTEVEGSKAAIEDKLNSSVHPFSYPNGLAADYSEEVKMITKQAGYQCAVSYIPGANPLSKLRNQLYDLKRIHVDNYVCRSIFPLMLNLPNRFI